MFNVSKSACMVFVPYDSKKIVSVSFPTFVINGNNLEFVKQLNYFGHIMTSRLSNSFDVDRVIRGFFTRTNSLVRNFAKCLLSVTKILFNTLCASVYIVLD